MLRKTFFFQLLLACICSASISSTAAAEEIIPFASSNQNPLVAIFGLPATAPATILKDDRTTVEFRSDIASSCSSNSNSRESVLLDGETYRLTLAARRGIGRNLEIGMELPYVMHRQGFLDSFIKNWHDFFGLPQGERDNIPEDQLDYRYSRNGDEEVNLTDSSQGLGDLRLTAGWQLLRQDAPTRKSLALRASLKLPTGDSDKLLGSGSTDLALWLSGSAAGEDDTVALFGSIGILFLSNGDVIADQQNNLVGFGSIGVGWQALDSLNLKLQVDAHSAFYDDSELKELSESAQLLIGGTLAMTEATALDIAVGEDIVVDSAPDVVFHIALRHNF